MRRKILPFCRILLAEGGNELDLEKYLDIEAVIENATYSDQVNLDTVKLMMEADVVTIRGTSVEVKEIEVTSEGRVRFHGNRREV